VTKASMEKKKVQGWGRGIRAEGRKSEGISMRGGAELEAGVSAPRIRGSGKGAKSTSNLLWQRREEADKQIIQWDRIEEIA